MIKSGAIAAIQKSVEKDRAEKSRLTQRLTHKKSKRKLLRSTKSQKPKFC